MLKEHFGDGVVLNGHPHHRLPTTLNVSFVGRVGAETRMGPAGSLAIGPGETVMLAPGGKHIMLMELTEPLVEGGALPLVLRFEQAGDVTVTTPILGFGARGPEDQ